MTLTARPGKVTLAEGPTDASSQATVTQPGRIPNSKAVVKGSGAHSDPYIGVYSHCTTNVGAGTVTVSLALMQESGDYAWLRLKKVHIFYQGSAGVTIWLGAAYAPTDGTTEGEMPIGRPITTTNATADVLEWDFGDGILLWRGPAAFVVGGVAGAWNGELAVELTGCAAADDFWLYAEVEWAVRQ